MARRQRIVRAPDRTVRRDDGVLIGIGKPRGYPGDGLERPRAIGGLKGSARERRRCSILRNADLAEFTWRDRRCSSASRCSCHPNARCRPGWDRARAVIRGSSPPSPPPPPPASGPLDHRVEDIGIAARERQAGRPHLPDAGSPPPRGASTSSGAIVFPEGAARPPPLNPRPFAALIRRGDEHLAADGSMTSR